MRAVPPSATTSAPPTSSEAERTRLEYRRPRLERRGDVRSNVLGPTAGPGDSPIGFNTGP
jgi:hypothetical protein